jgi:universal stress protein E
MTWQRIMFAASSAGVADNHVLEKLTRIASAMRAELELFHCVFDPGIGSFTSASVEQAIRDLTQYQRRQLEMSAEQLRARGLEVRASIRWDYPPHEGIVRQVFRHKPDLLVAQSTRRSRLGRLVLTYTDYLLIQSCPCPLLLIKTARPYSELYVVAAVDPTHAHDKPGALDAAILDAATELSRPFAASLHVFHACRPWRVALRGSGVAKAPEAVRAEVEAAYRKHVEAQVGEIVRCRGIPRDHVHVQEGDAALLIPEFAAHTSADIAVIGAVSRSSLRSALIGHTAERVLDMLDCDVMIVKPPGFRSPVPSSSPGERRATRTATSGSTSFAINVP